MPSATLSATFALLANFCFAFASLFFARFSAQLGSAWMNTLKASITLLGFCVMAIFLGSWIQLSPILLFYLFFSGFVGLGLGDIFLLKAFVQLGPARTLVLFAFQPMIFIFVDNLVFGYTLKIQNIIAIIIFIFCLILFSWEYRRRDKAWHVIPLMMALLGIALDGYGSFLTKIAFTESPELTSTQSNLIRTAGAVFFYFLFNFVRPIHLIAKFKTLTPSWQLQAILASFFGTFLSLLFYLSALKHGALSIVTAISVTAPIFSTLFESIIERRKPTKTLIACLVLFLFAFFINFSEINTH